MLPLRLTTLVIAPLAGKTAVCRGPAGVLLARLALTGGATISLTWLGPASGYSWFGARLAMPGIGLALALPTVVALLINRVPADQAGVASGLVRFSSTFHSESNCWGAKYPCWRPSSAALASASLTRKSPSVITCAPKAREIASGRKTCHAEMRLYCLDMKAHAVTSNTRAIDLAIGGNDGASTRVERQSVTAVPAAAGCGRVRR